MGMCCVLNTHYKTKKFVFLEDKYKVKEIIIMPKTVDISPYQEQLHNKIRKLIPDIRDKIYLISFNFR
jgi:hypothetical protein